MKKLLRVMICCSMLVFCLNACLAQETKPFIGDTWALAQSNMHFEWQANWTFTQTLKAKADGSLSQLWVHMGNNQSPYSARVVIKINGVEVFDRDFANLKQTFHELPEFSDTAAPTEFSLEGISQKVKIGDKIELQITPSRSIGMKPVLNVSEDWALNELRGYGKVALRFRLR